MSYVKFEGVRKPHIKKIFKEIADNYPPLKSYSLKLVQKPIRKTTMRARPNFRAYFRGQKKFSIMFNSSTNLADKVNVEEVPEIVLRGWFAHELGHVMDYRNRSAVEMLIYGIRYLMSRRYRKKVEHTADEYAIEYGFADEILATKKYILEHSDLPEKYKERFRKYYMSEENVHRLIEKLEEIQPDDANILEP